MLPFLEIPTVIVNNEQKEKEVVRRMQPTEIESYYPGFHFGTVVIMKSQECFLCSLSVDQFDEALLAYTKTLKQTSCKFGNLQLTFKSNPHVAN